MKRILLLSLVLIMLFTGCSAPVAEISALGENKAFFSQMKVNQNGLGLDIVGQGDMQLNKASNLSANSNVANESQLALTDSSGNPIYKIVYPEKTIEIIHDAAEVLRVALKNATGKDFKKQSDATPDANSYEILIGATNRAQSKQTLGEKEYLIKVDGKKVIIAGGGYYAIAVAVSRFKSCFSKESPFIEKNLLIKGTLDPAYRVAVSNSGDTSIDIYDITPFNTKPKLVKTFKDVGATGLNFRHTDKYGDVVVCASGTVVKVLNYNTGKVLWTKTGIAKSAHGAEILPNGVVAVASSTPNTVSFFDTSGSASKTVTLEDAHAVLWDPKYQVVWAAGYTEIRAYKVTLKSGTLTVTEDTSKRSPFNNTGAHDLAPVYYDEDKMWVSTFGKVYIYDKTTKKFSEELPGNDGIMCVRRVKGLGNFVDGSMITTYPDEKSTSLYTWTTEKLNFYFMYEGKLYYSPVYTPGEHYYKVRIVCNDYQ